MATMARKPILLLLLCPAFLAAVLCSDIGDYPTANLSTLWLNHPGLRNSVTYFGRSTIRPLLLHGIFGPTFAFGFICTDPCKAFFLSIYIVYTNSASGITRVFDSPPQVVWSANRGRPVKEDAALRLSSDGDLVLRDADGTFVWSTNTSGKGVTALKLLETGNLVLVNRQNEYLWESFDHPTCCMLRGQTLRVGQRLTSDSPNPAFVTLLDDGLRGFIGSNPPLLYFAQPPIGMNKSENISGFCILGKDQFALYMGTKKPFFSIALPSDPQLARFLRLDDDGHLRLFTWDDRWGFTDQFVSLLPNPCQYPKTCGNYGICSDNQCSCPRSPSANFAFFNPVNTSEPTLGCTPATPLSCGSMESHQLLYMENVSYFNYVDKSAAALRMTDVESCKQACLTNCSCKAAFFHCIGNSSLGDCYLPSEIFSLLADKLKTTLYCSAAFLKVQIPPAAPDVSLSRATVTDALPIWKRRSVIVLTSGIILAGTSAVSIFALLIRRPKRRGRQVEYEEQFDYLPGMPARFTYEEIKAATQNFKQKLGQGGFGTVFKGTLNDGTKIAVKRLDGVGQGKKEFLAEVETIGGIHHINLVRFVGFCVENSHRFLVLEYVPNGSLDKWIFGRTKDNALDWKTRRQIIVDIAKGLSYLHEDCTQRIAHLDIKPQNILLGENFNAKVADFGLSKLIDRDESEVMTRMRGTPGYLAPEWLTSVITEKVDVYSFGVLVMEILCGRKSLDPSQPVEAIHLIALLQEKLRKINYQICLTNIAAICSYMWKTI
ncbi:hypothetical protein HPP92_008567 [Vanilla planifolia]|uniref:Receptor-like serine/threonine-protein kinase n=1 Tax=Vanilla planifolia TaxID=51239 RepID=A0A835V5T1_VANPL|nr:hypothetical protein HPP92_008567 [Vanilla planifolia]